MKNLKSKGLIMTISAFICVAILGACLWSLSSRQTDDFKPDEPPSSEPTSSWSDSGTQSNKANENSNNSVSETSCEAQEEYPKVISEDENKVEIDFTASSKPTQTPPPIPDGKTEIAYREKEHEIKPDPYVADVTSPIDKPTKTSPPTVSSNGNGAVYDPVFGWVTPSEVQQSTGDSDGDLNKQVGNMG